MFFNEKRYLDEKGTYNIYILYNSGLGTENQKRTVRVYTKVIVIQHPCGSASWKGVDF